MARWSLLIVALLVSIAACQQQQAEEAGTTEEAAAAVDPAAVEDYIRTSADQYEQAVLAGDIETVTSFYADDAVLLPAGMQRAEGIDAIRSAYQEMFTMGKPTEFSIDPQSIVVSESGDLAYEIGSFSWTGPGPDGATMTDTGKYLVIWKPVEGGEWKIAADTWNSDQMMPGAAPSEGAPATQPEAPTGQ